MVVGVNVAEWTLVGEAALAGTAVDDGNCDGVHAAMTSKWNTSMPRYKKPENMLFIVTLQKRGSPGK
jgi:hypothetical protein